MKDQTKKHKFICLRAEGKSFGKIAKELKISKDTCGKWEKEFKEQITQLKAENLNELYESYYMFREARIKALGETLRQIDAALEEHDLIQVRPDKLLELKLKYIDALKQEYIDLENSKIENVDLTQNIEANEILYLVSDVLLRLRDGSITKEQANAENAVLNNLLRTYDVLKLEERVKALEEILRGRETK